MNTPLNQLEKILNFAQLICQIFTRKFSNITELNRYVENFKGWNIISRGAELQKHRS
ncbi:hypothetical protein PL11201_580069 [Planktothrix sp. PCC 11201]|nr:hypothetical protein PL11201_580069 [Planktothrix sp. PCC 11201]